MEWKQEMKKILGITVALLIVYLVIHYWANVEGVITLAVGAATPLLVGCVMAYVINILMGCYEKWYDKLFKVEVARKVKRIVCLILAFLSLIFLKYICNDSTSLSFSLNHPEVESIILVASIDLTKL